jgi:hypothetical protein
VNQVDPDSDPEHCLFFLKKSRIPPIDHNFFCRGSEKGFAHAYKFGIMGS